MRYGTVRLALVLGLLLVVFLLLPLAAAQAPPVDERGRDTTLTRNDPATPAGEVIADIWVKVIWVSAAIFLLVTVLLVYALVRWRHRRGETREVPQIHGNSKLEIAWTIGPALIMVWLLVISYNGLFAVDDPPDVNPDVSVDVIAHAFFWEYRYPDGNTSTGRDSVLRLAADQWVQLRVTSADVHHAFKIPGLDVMIDAMPGRVNEIYMYTGQHTGVYLVQCMRFCGAGHGDMHSTVEIFDADEQPLPYGMPPPEPDPVDPDPVDPDPVDPDPVDPDPVDDPEGLNISRTIQVETRSGYLFSPDPVDVEAGEIVEIVVTNRDNIGHDLTIGTWDFENNVGDIRCLDGECWQTPIIGPGETATLVIQAEEPLHIWCSPHHPAPGMFTYLTVDGEFPPEDIPEPLLPGPAVLVLLAILGGLVAYLRRRNRE